MKMVWNLVIILSGLTELLAAVSLIAGPEGVSAAGSGNMWSMHYGFAALAVASLSVWVWPKRYQRDAIAVTLGVFLTFHTGLCLSLALAGDQPVGLVLHGIVGLLSWIVFFNRRGLSEQS